MNTQITTETSASPSPRGHLAYLDGLRACAALYVALHHAMMSVPGMEGSSGFVGKLAKLLSFGHASVDLFIVLSGFCLMLPLLRHEEGITPVDAWTFYKRRARRILPPYFFALALSLVLTVFLIPNAITRNVWGNSVPIHWQDVLWHVFLVHDAIPSSYLKINYTFWSIAVEWRIYFVFPLLVLSWIKWGPYRTTLFAVITGYVLLYLLRFTSINTATAGVSPHFLGLFTLGMLSASISFAKPGSTLEWLKNQRVLWAALSIVFAFLTLIATKLPISHENQTPFCDLFVGLFSASFLIVVSTGSINRLRDFIGMKPLAFVGTFAYSLYLLHAPLLEVLWRYGVRPLSLSTNASFALLSILGIGIITTLSYVFFLFCERPFLRSKPRPSFTTPI